MTAESRREPAADSDAELMVRFQQGERECFDLLFQKYRRPLVSFTFRFAGRRDVAEELAQDIVGKCYRAASSYQPQARFSSWLFRIARNHCLNALRRGEHRAAVAVLDEGSQAAAGSSPEAEAEGRDMQRLVNEALAALPEKQRTALVLARLQHMPYEEIAAAMETSVSAVKSLLNRARRQLLARIGPHLGASHEM